MSHFSMIFVILTLTSIAMGKIIDKTTTIAAFRKGCWLYIDRVNLAAGELEIQVEVEVITNDFRKEAQFDLEIAVIPVELWEAESEKKCKLDVYTEAEKQLKIAEESIIPLTLNQPNRFKARKNAHIFYKQRKALNIVLRDCKQTFLQQNFSKVSNINIKLKVLMNGEHQSLSEGVYGWLLPLLIAVCALSIRLLKSQEENWVQYLVKLSLKFALGATIIKYIWFITYAYLNGEQLKFIQVVYLIIYSASDSLMLCLLIFLGFGWTVTFSSTRDFDLYVPLTAMLGMINVIMTTLNKVTDGQHDKYHIFDSVPAYVMIFFRLVGFAVFSIGIIRSFLKLKKDDKIIFRYFLQLTVIGIAYITFIPLVMLLVRMVESSYRKEVMFVLVEVVKYSLSLWLGYLGAGKRSAYQKIVSRSFMEKDEKYF